MKRLWILRNKSAREQELDRELRFHIEELTEANVARGMSPGEAYRQAVLEFGGREQVTQELRDLHGLPMLERTIANLKSAVRFMRRSPSFSVAIILTLALGIGANSAVFSAIDAILLRPLPFPHGDQLMLVQQFNPQATSAVTFTAPLRLEDWNRMNSTFQAMTGYYVQDDSETSGALPEKVTHAMVAARFLQVWGVAPMLGRDFTPEEEKFGGPDAVLISYSFWQRHFHGDPSAVGKLVHLNNHPYTIVGVMPRSFQFPVREAEIWSPVPLDSPYSQSRESTWYTVIGRLKPGVNLARARADLMTVQAQLARQFPASDGKLTVNIEPLKENTVGGVRRSLWILFGSVTLLLLIACTNIAALLLARTTQREHEIAIRFSLGASRRAVIGQLLTETFVLAVIGALLGLAVAAAASSVFHALAKDLPRVEEIHLDWRIVVYSLLSAMVATFLCGMLPALRATRKGLVVSLAQGARTQVSGHNPMQWTLVGVQVALAVTLLVGAGLLLRSFQELGRVTPGFNPSHVLTFRISASWGETADLKGLTQRIDHTLDVLRSVPGVEGAATAAMLPGVPNEYENVVKIEEGAEDPNRKTVAQSRFVSPGYFATMQIPLLSGEPCRDDLSTKTIVVNRSFANTYFTRSPAVGHHLAYGTDTSFPLQGEIRGIAGDAREMGLNREPVPTIYWCISAPLPDPWFLVRTRTEPMTMAETLRRKIGEIAPGRSVFDIMALQDHLDDSFAENRLRTLLLSLFALTAISLACIGIYGTLSYFVSLRQREIGLRLAMGALRQQITARFLLQGLRVAAIGCGGGLVLALIAGRTLSGMLYGVSAFDPPTMFGVLAIVLLVAALAALVPALRAARLDPMRVLREQ